MRQQTASNQGLILCSRYALPPNLLHLCGPEKQNDLKWYISTLRTDKGTEEILDRFSTLSPYLRLIAEENLIRNPFDRKVVESYWLGNKLLLKTSVRALSKHLTDGLKLKKKITLKDYYHLLDKIPHGGLPHHSFHVLNVFKRTGHDPDKHTLQTMDACIINWGKITSLCKSEITIITKPLSRINGRLCFGKNITRKIRLQSGDDIDHFKLSAGDYISYHWGVFCTKLNRTQLANLKKYTQLSITLAN